nr:virulence factor SrfB [Succinivibrionaceae bacterium]
ASATKVSGDIVLIENSGVQFLDLEIHGITLDPRHRFASGDFTAYASETGQGETAYGHPVEREYESADARQKSLPAGTEREETHEDYSIKSVDTLRLFDGVWLPVPYLSADLNLSDPLAERGPLNWARCRVVEIEDEASPVPAAETVDAGAGKVGNFVRAAVKDSKEKPRSYHLTFAFDTHTEAGGGDYYSLRQKDTGRRLRFCYRFNEISFLLNCLPNGQDWIAEWCRAAYSDLARQRLGLDSKALADNLSLRHHEAHYLNFLTLVGELFAPHDIIISGHDRRSCPVDCTLVLDVGNSRSFGIIAEEIEANAGEAPDYFSGVYRLILRDLCRPELAYDEPFPSRIQFSRPCLDYDGKSARAGVHGSFNWPSIVRVGPEAERLAAHRSSNEGATGLISPKRYLWNDASANNDWHFNSYSDQLERGKASADAKHVESAYERICRYMSSSGTALFAIRGNESANMSTRYSKKSTMTFMLMEIFCQALSQINSVASRSLRKQPEVPRRLKAIVLTVPPSMPQEEREIYRCCAYEALGMLWKSLGYDSTPASGFRFRQDAGHMFPSPPEIRLDWDEVFSGQMVYLYNEITKVYSGYAQKFVTMLRRPDAHGRFRDPQDRPGSGVVSARVASIDIGGGTSDLVITDLTYDREEQELSLLIPRPILSEGFRIAGDDLLRDIIEDCILDPLMAYIKESSGFDFSLTAKSLMGQDDDSERSLLRRSLITNQILIPVADRILFYWEHLPRHAREVTLSGTIESFLTGEGEAMVPPLDPNIKRPAPHGRPEQRVIDSFNCEHPANSKSIRDFMPGFDVMRVPLKIDLLALERRLVEGGFDLSRSLESLAELVDCYRCDALLLTGRPSRLDAIRDFFLERLALPPRRVIAMHRYDCGSWYPQISSRSSLHVDPKTTTALGALMCYKNTTTRGTRSFRVSTADLFEPNRMNFVGNMTEQVIHDHEVYLSFFDTKPYLDEHPELGESAEASDLRSSAGIIKARGLGKVPKVEYPHLSDEGRFSAHGEVRLGYRQFDYPNFTATPLYRIRLRGESSLDEMGALREALRVEYLGSEPDEIRSLLARTPAASREARAFFRPGPEGAPSEYERRRQEIEALATDPSTIPGLQSDAITALDAEHGAQVAALSGLDRLLGRQRRLDEEYLGQRQELLRKAGEERLRGLREAFDEEVMLRSQQMIGSHVEGVRQQCRKALALAQGLYDGKDYKFTYALEVHRTHAAGEEGSYPYPFIYGELKGMDRQHGGLPQLIWLELAGVEPREGGSVPGIPDLRECFAMTLETVICSQDGYWTESGKLV